MLENATKTPQKCKEPPKSDDLEVLIAEILKRARCTDRVKNGNYSRPQCRAIIAGLHEKILDYGGRIDALDMVLKMMVDEKEYFKAKVTELHNLLLK